MSTEDKKDKKPNQEAHFEEKLLDSFPKDLVEEPSHPDYDPMTISIWEIVNQNGILPGVLSGIKDPELKEQMEGYMYGLIATHQKSLDKCREHLSNPDTYKKVVETLMKARDNK
tara:strand:- start:32 stop:373 length:342 start_codon:yes stop_codon:yes gene_type:complete